MLTVLVAVSDGLLRAGIELLLQRAGLPSVVEFAGTRAQARGVLQERAQVVAIVDLDFDGGPAFDFVAGLHSRWPTLPILALERGDYGERMLRAIRSGAQGVVSATAKSEEFIRAVRSVAEGRRYVADDAVGLLFDSAMNRDAGPAHQKLSNREHEVLCLLGDGVTQTEIAGRLSLSVKTVSVYRTRLLQKLGARNTGDLIRYAVSNGLSCMQPN